jgi:hypothetical protein
MKGMMRNWDDYIIFFDFDGWLEAHEKMANG